MSNLKQFKALSVLVVGLLVALSVLPQWVQARVTPTIAGPIADEGDPLDSNDYSSGGSGSGTDADIHDQYTSTTATFGSSLLDKLLIVDGKLLVPLFSGVMPVFQIIDVQAILPAAVEYED